jgi:hypothetical protein
MIIMKNRFQHRNPGIVKISAPGLRCQKKSGIPVSGNPGLEALITKHPSGHLAEFVSHVAESSRFLTGSYRVFFVDFFDFFYCFLSFLMVFGGFLSFLRVL